ncbi:MAG TPA: HAD-IA family hydrolase [Patescibacteria group bacterium]|nr:HAD-IA family hydrolase [Patescibacteria group bacterium]
MAKDKITTVIFDAGGVLISWPREEVLEDIRNELKMTNEQIEKFWRKYIFAIGKGDFSESTMWRMARAEYKFRKVYVREDLLGRKFMEIGRPYKEVLNKVVKLSKDGYKVAVLSNTNQSHTKVFRSKGILIPFKNIYLSYKFGYRKPDKKLYKLTLKKLKVKPENVIFIDDLAENIKSAKDLGMHTILANNQEQIVRDINKALYRAL